MTLRRKVLLLSLWTSLVGASTGCPNPTEESDAGGADSALPDAPQRSCSASSECDDGLFCNGEEQCVSGRCAAGTALRCADDIACTTEFCSEETRGCVVRAMDADNDGHAAATCLDARGMALGDDCDDSAASVFPGALEVCDLAGVDEDCDPTTHGALDADSDGFEDVRCCNGASCGDDCNDAVRGANPMAVEVCNLIDDDCDGNIDEGVSVTGFFDMDGDGRGNPAMPRTACAGTAQFSVHGDDCDDDNALRSPVLPEVCDGQDNDCVGVGDAGASAANWYLDRDGDGFGTADETRFECARPFASVGAYVLLSTDCDDTNPANNPAQPERCDGVDNDCNGVADFVIAAGDLEDDDRDGIADLACTPVAGTDCDDRDPVSGPGSAEVCDGRDNDCDGVIDNGASSYTFYRDLDGDGFGSAASGVIVACATIPGYVRQGSDCNDSSAARFPGAVETCNGSDDDCSGTPDDFAALTSCAPVGSFAYACVRGTCQPSGCTVGRGECDGNPTTVCEADTTSPATCGATCAVCDVGQSCTSTGCSPRLTRGLVLDAEEAAIVDIVPIVGAGAGSTDALVALNVLGLGSFGLTPSGTPNTLGAVGSEYHGAVLRIGRDGTVHRTFQLSGAGTIAALTSSATHVYALGTYSGSGVFSTPSGPSITVPTDLEMMTTFVVAIRIADWAVESVAYFRGNAMPTDLALGSDGTLAIIGTYLGVPRVGPVTLLEAGEPLIFVAKLPASGSGARTNFSVAFSVRATSFAQATAITALGSDFFIAGNASGSITLGTTMHTAAGSEVDGFIARLSGADIAGSYFFTPSFGVDPERTLSDITVTSTGNLVVVGRVSSQERDRPVRFTIPPSLSPAAVVSTTFVEDPMGDASLARVATRGTEVIQAGNIDGTLGTVIPPNDLYRAIFFGSTDGASRLSTGRLFGSYFGFDTPRALAIDPDDGAIWIGGELNHFGKGGESINLDGNTIEVSTNSGFLFVFGR